MGTKLTYLQGPALGAHGCPLSLPTHPPNGHPWAPNAGPCLFVTSCSLSGPPSPLDKVKYMHLHYDIKICTLKVIVINNNHN